MTTTGETSEDSSSSRFPPKASILGHNCDTTMTTYTNSPAFASCDSSSEGEFQQQRFMKELTEEGMSNTSSVSCPLMWEGSCSDNNNNNNLVAERFTLHQPLLAAVAIQDHHSGVGVSPSATSLASIHPTTPAMAALATTNTNTTTTPLFAQQVPSSGKFASSGGGLCIMEESSLGSDTVSSAGSTSRSLSMTADPFTSSQSSLGSDHLQQQQLGGGYMVGGGSLLGLTSVLNHGHDSTRSKEHSDHHHHHHPANYFIPTTSTNNSTSTATAEPPISPGLQWTLDQHVPLLMKLLTDEETTHVDDHKVAPISPTTTTNNTAAAFGATTSTISDHSNNNNHNTCSTTILSKQQQQRRRAIPQHQPQFTLSSAAVPFEPTTTVAVAAKPSQHNNNNNVTTASSVLTPPSNASCFSVTSFTEGEGPVSSPDSRQLQSAGCEFVATPFAVLKADPLLANFNPGEDSSGVKEIFIGQLPFDFSPNALCDALRRLVHSPECSIVTRFKMGPKPTCAFLTVKETYEASLLELTKRILCDNNGMWVARTETGAQAVASVSKRRVALKKPGLPQRPMVLESVNQVSHGPKSHAHHRAAPPTYATCAAPCQSQGPAHGLYGHGYPQPSAGAGRGWSAHHQQQQHTDTFNNGNGGGRGNGMLPSFTQPRAPLPQQTPSRQAAAPPCAMSVCLCGEPHVVAMTSMVGSCSLCARDLPSGVMVRRCSQCPSTDICTVCVSMANGSRQQQQQQGNNGAGQQKLAPSSSTSWDKTHHQQYNQRQPFEAHHSFF